MSSKGEDIELNSNKPKTVNLPKLWKNGLVLKSKEDVVPMTTVLTTSLSHIGVRPISDKQLEKKLADLEKERAN